MKTNPCRLTYAQLIYMRESALWAAETWAAEARRKTKDAKKEALRYLKIFNYIEDRMKVFRGEMV